MKLKWFALILIVIVILQNVWLYSEQTDIPIVIKQDETPKMYTLPLR